MAMLTPAEKAFLDAFLHEATTPPFTGPATRALHAIGVEYSDLSSLAWAYDQEAPRTSIGWGHSVESPPSLPWSTREQALRRNREVERQWDDQRSRVGTVR